VRAREVLFVVIAGLTACRGNSAAPAPGSVAQGSGAASLARGPLVSRPDRGRTWIASELAKGKVPALFVSDAGSDDVYIYKLPSLKVLGKITGFSQPQGECSDSKGNVWIVDTGTKIIYELSHHGQLQNELSDKVGFPIACAWDPKTGNLAVMDIFGPSGVAGDVLVYPHGTGVPEIYTNPDQYYYNFGGYDAKGNLFFDGRDEGGSFMLSELPSRAQTAETITVSGGTIYFPGMVEWDAKRRRLVVGDQSCDNVYSSCAYTMAISAQQGTIKDRISLQNSDGGQICDMVQGTLYGSKIAGSDFNFCGSGSSATYLWPYPAGGRAVRENDGVNTTPVGAALSR
jgi:hypothetical protein